MVRLRWKWGWMVLLSGVLGMNAAGATAVRAWTLKDGRLMEASFVTMMGDAYVFKTTAGQQLKLKAAALSAVDLEYIELAHPPRLKIDFIRDLETVTFSQGYYGTYPRDPEQQGSFGFRVKQTSSRAYTHGLRAEMFAVAKQIGVPDKKYVLLDRQEVEFSLEARGKPFEFMSERQVRLENWHFEYGDSRAVDHGEVYAGYVVAIIDARGEVVAMSASHNWLEAGFEQLRTLKVGNYFDTDCVRCFPGRPQALRW